MQGVTVLLQLEQAGWYPAGMGALGRRSSLSALRWVAEEDLLYERASNTLHRPGCRRLGGGEGSVVVAAGEALWLVWAPVMCDCRPDVTLALGADRSERPALGA